MEYIHDNKPPISSAASSIFLDMVIWGAKDHDTQALTTFMERHGLGERSQTVVWLKKITVRLSMWRGRYVSLLSEDEWQEAGKDIVAFLSEVKEHYRPKAIEYDTRAFSVGLAKKARRQKHRIEDILSAPPTKSDPIWWTLS